MKRRARTLLKSVRERLPGGAAAPRRPRGPAARRAVRQRQALRATLRQAMRREGAHALSPSFADRVLRRLGSGQAPEEVFAAALLHLFRPVAVASLLLVLGLLTYNLTAAEHEAAGSTLEAALALPPVTLDLAYDLDLPSTP